MTTYNSRSLTTLIAALLFAAGACVDSIPPPELLEQGVVTYGERVYLVDSSFTPTGSNLTQSDICTRLTNVVTESSTLSPDQLIEQGVLMATDGELLTAEEVALPQNCFLPMDFTDRPGGAPGRLQVDTFEVTNELYQFCVDSDFCPEPDPSEEDMEDRCVQDDEGFFDCPIVQITQSQAANFCSLLGRRLPTAVESIIIRQQDWAADPVTDTRSPEAFLRFPGSGSEPASCTDAFIGGLDCGLPQQLEVGGQSPSGAAASDTVGAMQVGGGGTTNLFDVTGHVAEWTADGFTPPGARVLQALPWFCVAPVILDPDTLNPVCPSLPSSADGQDIPPEFIEEFGDAFSTCLFGYYDPDEVQDRVPGFFDNENEVPPPTDPDFDRPYDLYPVCLTSATGSFSGGQVALFGGHWLDGGGDIELGRVFSRRVEDNASSFGDPDLALGYGIRCVDDREAGDPNFVSTGEPFNFLPVDATFLE
ncbi:MAG: hypothetical protein ACFB9M_06775 [Myxococcota bacterium]